MTVLVTALAPSGCSSGMPRGGSTFRTRPRALLPGGEFDVSGYIGIAADSPGVLEMVERLRTNRPAGEADDESGAAFIYRDGIESAMEPRGVGPPL